MAARTFSWRSLTLNGREGWLKNPFGPSRFPDGDLILQSLVTSSGSIRLDNRVISRGSAGRVMSDCGVVGDNGFSDHIPVKAA